jgi:ribose 5-phosphate isomerase RpiB
MCPEIAADHGGYEPARDLIRAFLNARFKGEERFRRRLRKVVELQRQERSR